MRHLCRSFSITLQMIAAGEWKWKWSNSVLKSEMGIFWCISITNNVKSYKKFDGKAQTAKFTVFAREISSTALKTWKTRKTKTWITQNFQILYHIQGTTIGKLTSRGFRKCGTFWVYDFLKGSYWLSKFSNISIFFNIQNRCHKKKTRPQFWFFGLETNSQGNSYGGPDLLFVSDPKTQNCGRVFFFWHRLFFGTNTLLLPCADFEQQ